MEQKKDKAWIFFVISVSLILIDQLTKMMIKGADFAGIHFEGMMIGESIPILGDVLNFTYVENEGMAFGIKFGVFKIFLSLFSVFASAILAIIVYRLKDSKVWVRLGFALILAGAVGNLIDRVFYGVFYSESPLFYGRVVDFIEVDIPDINFLGSLYTHFPVFNVADSCVTCGVVLLLLFYKHLPNLGEILNFRKKAQPEISNSLKPEDNETGK